MLIDSIDFLREKKSKNKSRKWKSINILIDKKSSNNNKQDINNKTRRGRKERINSVCSTHPYARPKTFFFLLIFAQIGVVLYFV